MTRRSRLALRTIPVATSAPIQLVLALPTDRPVDRLRATPEPEPAAPAVALRRVA